MDYSELNQWMDKLNNSGLSIAFAESMTAGMLVNEFSKCPGASKVLKGSLVTYHPDLKIRLLNVDPTFISKYTPESQEVTTAMVKGLARLITADIAVAVTGLASEGGSEGLGKPVGTVFVSVLYKNKLHEFKTFFDVDKSKSKEESKNEIMSKTVDYVFDLIKKLYKKQKDT